MKRVKRKFCTMKGEAGEKGRYPYRKLGTFVEGSVRYIDPEEGPSQLTELPTSCASACLRRDVEEHGAISSDSGARP